MKEAKGSMWKASATHYCVTTNGIVKSNGDLVMGAGIALQAKNKHPHVPHWFGQHVLRRGNTPCAVRVAKDRYYVSFPTKHDYRDPSDLDLIIKSAKLIAAHVPKDAKVSMSRPGCGNGGLSWDIVKPAISSILDDRFTVYSF